MPSFHGTGEFKGPKKAAGGGVPKGMLNVCEGAAWKCNFPMSPHVRPLVVWSGWSVAGLVGLFVIIFLKGREVTLP